MKKSDLRTGMIGVTRDGDLFPFVKIDGVIYRIVLNTLYEFETWSYDLINTSGIGSCWDIVKVYKTIIDYKYNTPLWERKEQIELTLDEIADKFNIDVKQLKIKK